jgi:hypothetical protein
MSCARVPAGADQLCAPDASLQRGSNARHRQAGSRHGIAAIAAAQSHFAQHLLSASANVQVGARWSPYVEVYWLSRLEPRGPRVVSMDAGAIYTVSERVAVDGGVLCGLAASDARPAVFGGLSVILGENAGRKGIHARLREAQRGGDR